MAKFHQLMVSEVRKETDDCVSIAFEIPPELKEEYKFTQGQYLTLKLMMNGEELRRTYSICSSPLSESELRIASKRIKNGKVSNFLFEKLKPGDGIEVMTPMGSFFAPLNPAQPKKYLMFAGGSGITPIFSILKTVLHAEPASKISLFYANRDERSIIFRHQLDILEKYYYGRLEIFHILENPSEKNENIFTGILTEEKTEELLKKYTDIKSINECFICGPPPMMKNIKSTLEKFNVDEQLIHLEYFSAVMEDLAKAEKKEIPEIPSMSSRVTVILDGVETSFELNAKGKSILETAIENDLDVPYACRAGVCSTCKAKLLEGKVKMDINYALTQSEVNLGFILTCQSHPVTEKVVASYDEI